MVTGDFRRQQWRRLGQLTKLNAVERFAVHSRGCRRSVRYNHDLTIDNASFPILITQFAAAQHIQLHSQCYGAASYSKKKTQNNSPAVARASRPYSWCTLATCVHNCPSMMFRTCCCLRPKCKRSYLLIYITSDTM